MGIGEAAIAGGIAAVVHVLSGADHLAAVLPMVMVRRVQGWMIGVWWGLGHTLGMLGIGMALWGVAHSAVPVEQLSAYSEQLVGVSLIVLGGAMWYRLRRPKRRHVHPHVHSTPEGPAVHIHAHRHEKGGAHRHAHDHEVKSGAGVAFGFGVLHGLAGLAHFVAFLPVLGLGASGEGIAYIAGFGVGTIGGMAFFALAAVGLRQWVGSHRPAWLGGIQRGAALFSVLVGMAWVLMGL